jgi:hypothetical protein
MRVCQVFHMLVQLEVLCILLYTLIQTIHMQLVWFVEDITFHFA